MRNRFTKTLSFILSLVFVLLISTSCSQTSEGQDKVVLGNFSYESCVVSNKILQILIEQGYNREVELVQVETSSGMVGLERGDISATSELWLDNRREWFDEVNNKSVVALSDTYTGKVEQGWYVPKYVTDNNPEIKNVEDLIEYSKDFQTEGNKGIFLNAPSGWNSSIITQFRFDGYKLGEYYELTDPGSGSGLDMTISSYYEKKLPFVTYYWEPTWLLGSYEMVKLEEVPYDESVWNEEGKYLCSYPEPIVKILANKEFTEKEGNKEVVGVLSKYTVEASIMNQILSKAQESGDSEYSKTIKEFMKSNRWWEEFISEEALTKVNEYLKG